MNESYKQKHSKPAVGFLLAASIVLSLIVNSIFSSAEAGRAGEEDPVWESQSSGGIARLNSIFFIDRNRGWAAGANGTLLETVDGGASWKKTALPERHRRQTIRDLWLLNDGRICLLGEYGLTTRSPGINWSERVFVLLGLDGGAKWTDGAVEKPPTPAPAPQAAAEPAARTTSIKSLPDPVLVRMVFAPGGNGWACGESGTIQHTKDGGRNWTIQKTDTRKILYDLSAIDEGHVWVVGATGTILRTTDGGQGWVELKSGVNSTLRGVHFIDSRQGWAVGSEGVILATIDSGSNWMAQYSGTKQTLNDVFFINRQRGWTAGERGTLLETGDGGATWNEVAIESNANLNRLFFIAPDLGWVAGASGVIYRYGRPGESSK